MRDRRPSRGALLAATVAITFSALLPEIALAHLNLQPRLVEQGRVADLVVDLPPLRPGGAPPNTLTIEVPGFRMLTSRFRETAGGETRWDVRGRIDAPPGILDLVLRAGYADGSSIEVDERLTVIPAKPEEPFPLIEVIVGGGLALAFAVIVLRFGRRRAEGKPS